MILNETSVRFALRNVMRWKVTGSIMTNAETVLAELVLVIGVDNIVELVCAPKTGNAAPPEMNVDWRDVTIHNDEKPADPGLLFDARNS